MIQAKNFVRCELAAEGPFAMMWPRQLQISVDDVNLVEHHVANDMAVNLMRNNDWVKLPRTS